MQPSPSHPRDEIPQHAQAGGPSPSAHPQSYPLPVRPLSGAPSPFRQKRIGNFPESGEWGDEPDAGGADDAGGSRPRTSVTALLVELFYEHYEVVRDSAGHLYAVARSGPRLAQPLSAVQVVLRARYFEQYGDAPAASALSGALGVVEGQAALDPPRVESVWLRVGRLSPQASVVDLAGPSGQCVELSPAGWSVRAENSLLMRRSELTAALPAPEPGTGNLHALQQVVPVPAADWPLVYAWLVCALLPDIPHPVLAVFGEQGSAKSSTARILAALVDPSAATTRSAPTNLRDWSVTASGSWVVLLDNLSAIPDWLSDALCRAVTGESYTSRKLYTDTGVSVLSYRVAPIVTAIHPGALRGDLADRLVTVRLPRIEPEERRDELELAAAWESLRPVALAGLLDLAVEVLNRLPDIQLAQTPRMADYARVLAAVDSVLGTAGLPRYLDTERLVAAEVVESDPFSDTLVAWLRANGGRFQGTALTLLQTLNAWRKANALGSARGWPDTAQGVADRLRRTSPALSRVGVTVHEPVRRGHNRDRIWELVIPNGDDAGAQRPAQREEPRIAAISGGQPPAAMPEADGGGSLEVGLGEETPPLGWVPPGYDPDEVDLLTDDELGALWQSHLRLTTPLDGTEPATDSQTETVPPPVNDDADWWGPTTPEKDDDDEAF